MATRLNKIYTKTGDSGETGLAGGERIPKASARINAIGDIDELNAQIGVLRNDAITSHDRFLAQTQHQLFNLGGELAMPGNQMFSADAITAVENELDRLNADLPPLKEFILPGGSPAAAQAHVARCVCRRAERSVVALSLQDSVNPASMRYLNRLSDYLFVLARAINKHDGLEDIPWANPYRE